MRYYDDDTLIKSSSVGLYVKCDLIFVIEWLMLAKSQNTKSAPGFANRKIIL